MIRIARWRWRLKTVKWVKNGRNDKKTAVFFRSVDLLQKYCKDTFVMLVKKLFILIDTQ